MRSQRTVFVHKSRVFAETRLYAAAQVCRSDQSYRQFSIKKLSLFFNLFGAPNIHFLQKENVPAKSQVHQHIPYLSYKILETISF